MDENYRQYLKSPEWAAKKTRRLAIDNRMCQMCGCTGTSNNKLVVHHFTYKRLYNEDVFFDLVTVCENCHTSIHKVMNRVTDSQGHRGWTEENKRFSMREYAFVISQEGSKEDEETI